MVHAFHGARGGGCRSRCLLEIAGDVTAPTYAELHSGAWQHPECCGGVRENG
jgi:hypothetical protein